MDLHNEEIVDKDHRNDPYTMDVASSGCATSLPESLLPPFIGITHHLTNGLFFWLVGVREKELVRLLVQIRTPGMSTVFCYC